MRAITVVQKMERWNGLAVAHHWWIATRVPILIFAVTRAGLFVLSYLGLVFLPQASASYAYRASPGNLFLDGWFRWDAGWFASIVGSGYTYPGLPDGQSNVAFFPLYPLSIKLFNFAFTHTYLSGVIISNLACLGSLLLLYRLGERHFGADVAGRAVLLLAVYPWSFYFTAVYSDALFCFLALAAFCCAERERWLAAGLCLFLASATRFTGIALMPSLALIYLHNRNFNWRRLRPGILWLALGALGPLMYFAYLDWKFGNPLLYFKVMSAPGWSPAGRGLDFIAENFRQIFTIPEFLRGNFSVAFMFNFAMGVILALTLIPIFRRQGPAAGLFSLTLLAASASQWVGLGRYGLAIFPAFIAWSLALKNRWAYEGVLVVSAMLLALWTLLFTHFYWVT